MAFNLGEKLSEFRQRWIDNYHGREDKCDHHKQRYDEGWVSLGMQSYAPALGRFRGKTSLGKTIVGVLESERKYVFNDQQTIRFETLEEPLEEIMFNIPFEIKMLMADYGASSLMIDREAHTIDGTLIENMVEWYIEHDLE
tara:strand:- start:2937 stop:3359 length:423 start_codon:yes stop_codon:yes gene_type:complete